jgi:ATP-grasp domain
MDTQALEQLLLWVAQLAEDFPEVSELDLNPVVTVPDGVTALDVELELQPVEDDPEPHIRSLADGRVHRPNY